MAKMIFPLFSGGVDSTIAILERIKELDFAKMQPIFINYGQKAWKQEWMAVTNACPSELLTTNGSGSEFQQGNGGDLRTCQGT